MTDKKTTITKAEFIKSVINIKDLPQDNIPHICVLGKSNVGKSSFINKLCKNNKLARVSKEAGRTKMLNFFLINDGAFYLVDFPGYGYHAGGKNFDAIWASLIEKYFSVSQNIVQVLALVDIRHKPGQNDLDMIQYLYVNQIPFVVLASKADKIAKTKLPICLNMLASCLKIGKDNIIPFSSSNNLNIDKITQYIFQKVYLDI
ncbi:MAG TPA: YihA family ribosome biogenesis GTP-binding protein [Clostridiales bacterium]|jgi:GTP-binding protein|nr:YihA family ribosome biogenesis GTP-binding protein [Clostridiales bacterium]